MMKKLFNLQFFATGDNNDLAARNYQLEFKKMLEVVFKKQSYFADFFGGGIEALDGVQNNETAFYVKTSDIPVVVGTGYDKETELGKSNRFGDMTEVVYTTTPVNYSWGWNWNEGIDRQTVNNDYNAAIADRVELQARAKTKLFNAKHAAFISASAAKVEPLADYSADNVAALFNNLSKYYTDIEAVGTLKAKVNAELYNAIVDHPLTTSAKGSATNIDKNGVVEFKGFVIEKVPATMFIDGECCYTYVEGVGKAFTGINTARTIEATDFDGVAFQGAGKAGEYILPDNKKAVAKVTITAA